MPGFGRIVSPADHRDLLMADLPVSLDPLDVALVAYRKTGSRGALLKWMALVTDRLNGDTPPPLPPPPATPGRIWHDPTIDTIFDQGQTGHCHPGDTLIRMADGSHKPITDVRLLDRVRTAEGHIGEVTQCMVRLYVGDMLTIRLRGHSGVRATTEHPILTRRGYVRANELIIGDEVAVTRSIERVYDDALEVHQVINRRSYKSSRPARWIDTRGGVETIITAPPESIALDARFGRLLGLYAAEGYSSDGGSVRWAYGAHEADTLVPETVELIREVLGAETRVQHRPNNVVIVVLGGKHWKLLFDRLIGKGAAEKGIADVLTGSDAFREAMLLGWIAGDGHRRRNEVSGVTVSRRLALDMFSIANDLGLRPTLRSSMPSVNQAAATRRERWEVTWAVGAGRPQSALDDGATWRKVVAISSEDYVGHVYNLEVEGDHSYVADGLGSHNCVGFAGAGLLADPDPRDPNVTSETGHELYYACKSIDNDGANNREGGSYVRTLAKELQGTGRVGVYAWAKTTDEITAWLHDHGPVVVGSDWYDGMMDPDTNGLIHPQGPIVGGHAYVIVGAVDANGQPSSSPSCYLIRNSWGVSWGNQGTALIDIGDFRRTLMNYDGEALVTLELPHP